MILSTPETADAGLLRTGARAPLIDPSAATSAPSAVSWGAIFAGAAGAAALSMILLILGTGLGLSSVSPWRGEGLSATSFGVSTIVWITFTQLAASGMGGYLAGRLRTKWAGVHTDEVYFRDTAHGFLAWAVASLATAALLTTTIGAIVSGGAQAGAAVAGTVASTGAVAGAAAASKTPGEPAGSDAAMGYFTDSLFRVAPVAEGSSPTPAAPTAAPVAPVGPEVGRIFANAVRSGALPADDTRYLGQLVSQRTGLGQVEAERRVTEAFTRMQAKLQEAEVAARDAADKARKATAYASLWLFVSLLAGAFVASLAATFGGRLRDGV